MMVNSHLLVSIAAGSHKRVRLAVDDLLSTELPEGGGLVYADFLQMKVESYLEGLWFARAQTVHRWEFEEALMQSLRELQLRHPNVFISGYSADGEYDLARTALSRVICWSMKVGDQEIADNVFLGLRPVEVATIRARRL